MVAKHSNNASSTLAGSINSSVTSLAVASGDAAKFPSLAASEWFPLTVVDSAGSMEIMKVTARSGATLTVVRGQEGTTAKSFAAGSKCDIRLTAASLLDHEHPMSAIVGLIAALADKADDTEITALNTALTTLDTDLTADISALNTALTAAIALKRDKATPFVTIASAATLDLGAATPTGIGAALCAFITGSVTISSFGNTAPEGTEYLLRFNAALTVTNGANLVTLDGANITTTAGMFMLVKKDASNVWRVIWYSSPKATAAIGAALTDTVSWMTAAATKSGIDARLNIGGSAPAYANRAWWNFNGTGTVALRASGNILSITDNGTGDYTVNFTTAMQDANYAVFGTGDAVRNCMLILTMTVSALRFNSYTGAGSSSLVDLAYATGAVVR